MSDIICQFKGGVRLIKATDCDLWVVNGDKNVELWDGNFDDYTNKFKFF